MLWSCVQTKSVDPHQDRLILLRIFCGNFFADFSFLNISARILQKNDVRSKSGFIQGAFYIHRLSSLKLREWFE